MSREAIQGIVSQMADAFIAASLADRGVYTTENYPDDGTDAIDCRVFIERGKATMGDHASAVREQYRVTLLLSEIPDPVRGSMIEADGDRFTLVKLDHEDDAVSKWFVTRRPG